MNRLWPAGIISLALHLLMIGAFANWQQHRPELTAQSYEIRIVDNWPTSPDLRTDTPPRRLAKPAPYQPQPPIVAPKVPPKAAAKPKLSTQPPLRSEPVKAPADLPEQAPEPVPATATQITATPPITAPPPPSAAAVSAAVDGERAESSPQSAQTSTPDAYLARNLSTIHQRINNRTSYPVLARKRGWQGEVILSFQINSDGSVADITVTSSCGIRLLDRSAIKAVISAAPFPSASQPVTVVLPVTFRLN